jgi:two-component system OmpR family response regulator/two-component system response regulator QseB
MRILVVEDDPLLGDGIKAGLEQAGFAADWVRDGTAAELALGTGSHAAVLLDLGLPRLTGLELLRRMRSAGDKTPGAHRDGARRGRGPDQGPGQRRRRLSGEAIRPARARRALACADPPLGGEAAPVLRVAEIELGPVRAPGPVSTASPSICRRASSPCCMR